MSVVRRLSIFKRFVNYLYFSGITGWYSINIPCDGWQKNDLTEEGTSVSCRGIERLGGGLEIAIKFAHQDDLERLLHAARSIGWSPDFDTFGIETSSIADELESTSCQITIQADSVCFLSTSALSTTQIENVEDVPMLNTYIRYKFYDRGELTILSIYFQYILENYLLW